MNLEPEYTRIVTDWLKITPEFLNKQEETIRTRLRTAYEQMTKEASTSSSSEEIPKIVLENNIYSIHQCLHLANTIVLMGSIENLEDTIRKVQQQPRYAALDPTTVLTIATLFYLLKYREKREDVPGNEVQMLHEIRRRFDRVNWMIGLAESQFLGIEPVTDPTLSS
jgi:hypothetical protein